MTVKQLKQEIEVKDKFIAVLAHDLRNPIGLLKNFSNLLLEQAENYSNDELVEKLEFINELSNNTFNLLDNLIIWLKSQNGNINFNGALCDLDKIFKDAFSTIKHHAEIKNITIDIHKIKGIKIFTDPNILSTILRNLLSNAIKYSYEGSIIKIVQETDKNSLTIKISDLGTGIDQDELERILENEKNIKSVHGTRGEAGTGIGLNLCKTLVSELNGNLWGESEVNKGTTMFVSIPLLTESSDMH